MTGTRVVSEPADLDGDAIRAVAAGATPVLAPDLLDRVDSRRREMLAALEGAGPVYGVTTGMGAQGGVLLDEDARAEQSHRLLVGRAVGGAPWLSRSETRAVLGVRLRDFLTGDAGVSADLCRWLVTLLERDVLPAIPRDATASAGEIVPLAHAFAHVAGAGQVLDASGTAVDAAPVVAPLEPPVLGAKEGVALLQGRPVATALALLRVAEARTLSRQWAVAVAAELDLVRAAPGPYLPEVARGDDLLAGVLDRVRGRRDPRDLRETQVPVSFRVVGPVLAAVERAADGVEAAADRSLSALTDSPAYLPGRGFASTPGFHAVDLALALDGLRTALVHAAQNGVARLHRLLDPRLTGLPAQLAASPGEAGMVVVHKQVAGEVAAVAGEKPAVLRVADTALGQEDVQSSAPAAAEQVRRALNVARRVLAAELLALHQARLVGWAGRSLDLDAAGLPDTPADQPRGDQLAGLAALLRAGWPDPSYPSAPVSEG